MKKIILILSVLLISFAAFSQASTDPSDNFYTQVQRWETLKLIKKQPPLRPYPVSLIKDILSEVIEGDNPAEAENARACYEDLFKKAYIIKENVEVNLSVKDSMDKQFYSVEGLDGDIDFPGFLSAGYKLDFVTSVNPFNDCLPQNVIRPYFLKDGYPIGPVYNFMEVDGSIAATFGNCYVQAGINHNSFGPFYDENIVISANAKHTANFSFVYNGEKWNFTQGLFILNATNGLTQDMFPNKLMMMHAVSFTPFDWATICFYENVIYGKRFDPSYFIPMLYMVTQGVTGYEDDNLFMGLNLQTQLMKGLVWNTDFYLDDVGFSGLKEYHSIKLRAAAQTGFTFVPEKQTWLEKAQFNYTMVSPFMYAHYQPVMNANGEFERTGGLPAVNYQIYTTCGQGIGSQLDPNSDKFALSASFKPVKGLKLTAGAALIRHGNVSEGLTEQEQLDYLNSPEGYFTTDGGIRQDPLTFSFKDGEEDKLDYLDSAWYKFMFLNQKTIQYTVQANAGVMYTFPDTKAGRFSLGLDYTFEHINNYGVSSEIFKGTGTMNADGEWTPGTCTAADVQKALDEWRKNLVNVTNHYVTFYFKYQF